MQRFQLAKAIAAGILVALVTWAAGVSVVRAEDPRPQPCSMHLVVELTPDVPNPSDPGFLASLLGDHPGHYLTLNRVLDDTHIDVQLYGPGPVERCRAVVDSMRNDGRVLSIDVQ
jgi:hypothetical protein